MLQRIREPFGKAGTIVAVIALVAALAGGAYAAGGVLTGQQKKEVKKIAKKIAKKFAGKDGKDGAQGAPGAAGAQGPKGDNGANGTDGSDGESVTGEAATAAECSGVAGGVKYTLKGTTTKICNGKNGTNGENVNVIELAASNGSGHCEQAGGAKFVNGTGEAFACSGVGGGGSTTLEEGHSETGFWLAEGENGFVLGETFTVMTISFPIPLATAPTETIVVDEDATAAEKEKCPGELFTPEASPGILCLYPFSLEGTVSPIGPGAQTIGAVFFLPKTYSMYGSWAVKAPEAP